MNKLTVKELEYYFKSKNNGAMELFFEFLDNEYVFIFYFYDKKISFQKCSNEINEEKYYFNFIELLNDNLIAGKKLIDIFQSFDFYEEWYVSIIKDEYLKLK